MHYSNLDKVEASLVGDSFIEEGMFVALASLCGDKAPGLDGFTMAFWQHCLDFVKTEVLRLFADFNQLVF